MSRIDSNANANVLNANVLNAADRRLPTARPARYRSRDYGSGYGNSSGYAAARRYTPGSQPAARFRMV